MTDPSRKLIYTDADCPRFETVKDNYGNSWVNQINAHNYILTDQILKPGDLIILTAITYNPSNELLFYNFKFGFDSETFSNNYPSHAFEVTAAHVSRSIAVYIRISRKFNGRLIDLDETLIQFRYTVTAY